MTVTEILLAVLCGICALGALVSVRESKAVLRDAEELVDRVSEIASRKVEERRGTDEAFTTLDRKVERIESKYVNLKREQEHLHRVVMQHIQEEGEETHG